MAERRARAFWKGTLTEGMGEVSLESSGLVTGAPVTWASRTESPNGRTSPEELLASAQAACYAMALSSALAKRNAGVESLEVTATCAFEKVGDRFGVTSMELDVTGNVPGMDQGTFEEVARAAEQGCPISNAIRGNVDIRLDARLA